MYLCSFIVVSVHLDVELITKTEHSGCQEGLLGEHPLSALLTEGFRDSPP